MELTYGNESLRLAPSHMIASNLGFARAIERFLQQRNASTDDLPVNGALRAFSAKQFLIPCKGEAERIELFRGSTLVAPIRQAMPAVPPRHSPTESLDGC